MALPILETPTYELTLPSTGKLIKYRPFLVKEYKILLTAVESDTQEITRVLIELIDNCTFKKLDMNQLAHFDIEYIFINLRAKSIGELTDLAYKCSCEFDNSFQINLLDVNIKNDKNISNKIMVSDNVGIILRYPKFEEMLEIYDNLKTEKIIDLVSSCITKIFTKDEIFETSEVSKEEVVAFLETFNKEQFEKIENFFVHMPRIVHELDHSCTNCGKTNTIVLEGLQNFFV